MLLLPQRYVFSSKSQLANPTYFNSTVVVATTKVRIFKQITTMNWNEFELSLLLLLPQRYVFSSKSQQYANIYYKKSCCCCYHKGTYFQANHNLLCAISFQGGVVVATTKVRIFKQITTKANSYQV